MESNIKMMISPVTQVNVTMRCEKSIKKCLTTLFDHNSKSTSESSVLNLEGRSSSSSVSEMTVSGAQVDCSTFSSNEEELERKGTASGKRIVTLNLNKEFKIGHRGTLLAKQAN